MTFLLSTHEGDFALYAQVWDEVCGWFHVMDHTSYAQWLPVHVGDMVMLADAHLHVHEEFVKLKGNFVDRNQPR